MSRVPHQRRSIFRTGLPLAAAVALALFAVPAHAAPEPTAPPAEAVTPRKVEPIPVAEVAGRAERASAELREAMARLGPDPALEELEKQIEDARKLLQERLQAAETLLAGPLTRSTVTDLQHEWIRRGEELVAWRRTLTQRAKELDDLVNEILTYEETWEQTRTSAVAAGAPHAVLDQIGTILQEISGTRRKARARRSHVLTLQNHVVQDELALADALERARAVDQELRSRLLEPDSAPLWTPPEETLRALVARRVESTRGELRQFAGTRPPLGRLALHGLIFLAVLAGASVLRQRVARWTDEDPDLGDSARLFESPFSVALIAALPLTFWIYPFAPSVVLRAAGLLALVPALRLLPPLLAPAHRPILYAAAFFFVADRLRDVASPTPSLERLLFAVETAAALAFVVWLLRRRPRLRDGLAFAARIAGLGFAVALTANVLGYLEFAWLVGDAILKSSYAAIVLYGGARIANAAVEVMLQTRAARRLRLVRLRGEAVAEWSGRLIGLAVILGWVDFAAEQLAIREEAWRTLVAVLTASLSVGTVEISLGDVLAFFLTIAAAFALSGVVRFVLQEDVFPRVTLQRGVPNAITTTAHYAILLLGFFLALGAAGFDLGRFTLLAGAFGVGIGFGLQNVVNNFVSGLILLFERPIQVGDSVEVGGLLGEVARIGIRSSTLRTYEGAEVIVPNATLIAENVVNWTLSDRQRRIEIPLGVAYGSDPERVQQLLLEAATSHPLVLAQPAPEALFQGFGDNSLDFVLRAWIGTYEMGLRVRSELAVALNAALRKEGIEIPFPQRDVHLRSVDPGAARTLACAPDAEDR